MTSDDPNAGGPVETGPADEAAINASNYGWDGKGDVSGESEPSEGERAFGAMVLAFDIQKALDFLHACETSDPRVRYKLGGKCGPGQVPGRDFQAIDCSGFVREAVRRATNLGNKFPDGSVVQHDWVKARGFDSGETSEGSKQDGTVRIAFLSPGAVGPIGHVTLVWDGKTLESHGGVGPDSRPWTNTGWQAATAMYVLRSA
jgi:hypothetical protein